VIATLEIREGSVIVSQMLAGKQQMDGMAQP
jgi:hypothetical protein